MALRLLQIFIPEETKSKVEDLVEGREILGAWSDESVENRWVIQLLVPANEVEPIMDRFEEAYADVDDFRFVLLPVEASLPRPEAVNDDSSGATVAGEAEGDEAKMAGRVSREELYHDVTESLGVDRVYVAMTILSSIVAAVGLIRDDVAVIIGAMVIAPLLVPNVAMSLATTLGDLRLLRRALVTNIAGVAMALVVSLLAGWIFTVDPEVPSLASRTHFGVSDLVLALAAGSAGTFAFTRGLSGAVIGVMVAVALMPPLVAFGMLLASGHFEAATGAFLLLVANVVCVNLAGVATFLAQGVRPRAWWEEERARKSILIAVGICLVLLLILGVILMASDGGDLGDLGALRGGSGTE